MRRINILSKNKPESPDENVFKKCYNFLSEKLNLNSEYEKNKLKSEQSKLKRLTSEFQKYDKEFKKSREEKKKKLADELKQREKKIDSFQLSSSAFNKYRDKVILERRNVEKKLNKLVKENDELDSKIHNLEKSIIDHKNDSSKVSTLFSDNLNYDDAQYKSIKQKYEANKKILEDSIRSLEKRVNREKNKFWFF